MPTIDGIASGIDTTAIITAIANAARAQQTPLLSRIDNYERRREGIAELSTRLQTLADKLGELNDPNTLVPLKSTLTDESQFTVETSEANIAGQFSVQVESLASRSTDVSAGFADPEVFGAIGAGTFSVTVGGETTDIMVDGTNDSLNSLAEALNDVDGVQAYVVNTGEGAEPYKLVVTAEDSGLQNGLTFANTTGTAALDLTQTVPPVDAHITINGLDVYSADNTLVDPIPGVTMTLTSVGDEPALLGLERDQTGLKERLTEFVDTYNEVSSYLRVQNAFDSEVGIRGRLVGEATATRVVGQLGSMLSAEYASGSSFTALSQLGIKTENNGDISLDEEVFEAAFSDRYQDVVDLLTSEDGPFQTIQERIESVYVDEDSGTLMNRDETLEGLIGDANDQVDRIGARVSRTEDELRQQFTAMELAISSYNSTSSYLSALLPSTGLLGSS
ncbi:MAG: flagellar hook-associated protein 2 [Myxococcota bacterium]|jgi:flagellar hook-associated protein 2